MSAVCCYCHQELPTAELVHTVNGTYQKHECLDVVRCKDNRPKAPARTKDIPTNVKSLKEKELFEKYGITVDDLTLDEQRFQMRDGVARYTHAATGNRYTYSRFGRVWERTLNPNIGYDDVTLAEDPDAL